MKSKKKNCGCGKMSVRKKMEHGGLHTDPTEPTRADSLALYNNALDVINYYENQKSIFGNKTYSFDSNGAFKTLTDENKKRLGTDAIWRQLDRTASLMPGDTDYREQIDNYHFYQREVQNDILDRSAPRTLYDTRIQPHGYVTATNRSMSRYFGDAVTIPSYDPIAIAPWDELTPAQLKERVQKYGNSGVPKRWQDPNQPGYGVQGSGSSPTTTQSSNITTPSRPRIEIDKMPPLDFSIDLPTTLQPIERPEGDRLIDTQDIYRTPLSNRNNVRGDEQSLDQVGERRVYERPDGTRYTSVDRFSPEMIRQLRRLQRERERGTVTF